MTVQLRVNMILENGAYLPVGALVDEEIIPPICASASYLCAPGEVPELVPTTLAQPEQDEKSDDDYGDDESPPPETSSPSF